MAEKADDGSIAFTEGGDNDSIYKDEEEEDGGEDMMLTTKLDKLSLKTKPSPMCSHISCNALTKTPTRTPIKKKYSIPPTPPHSLSGSVQDYSPSLGSIDYNDACQIYGITDPEPLLFQNGTKSNPYITFVNTYYPERNRGMFGFEVSYMGDIQFKKFKCQAFKIRAIVSPLDFIAYKMSIPSEHKFPQFKDCCTILKGPSRVFWHRENKVFEETVAETILNAATKSAFQRDTLKIDRDETCGQAYCLFVFPVGTILDNNIFSGASNNIAVECMPLKLEQRKMNEFGLMWTIGVAGGEELVDDKEDNNVDYSSLFKKEADSTSSIYKY